MMTNKNGKNTSINSQNNNEKNSSNGGTMNISSPTVTPPSQTERSAKLQSYKFKEKSSKPQAQIAKKCEYFNPKRKRRCGLQVRADLKYCFAHMSILYNDTNTTKDSNEAGSTNTSENQVTRIKNGKVYKRVKCTVDPSHTVWEDKLTKHVKHCNAMKAKLELKDKIEHCDWFGLDYNIKDVVEAKAGNGCGGYTEKTNACELEYDESQFKSFISQLMNKVRGKI
ncbi:unnamed protein product [Ambrosiozyma monospora]|uniref:tRNA:m(4)X modification enzyme TRM13 n=1 Tax=Ambrosiozyma monospora TaxID=43982 RepID=A0A9W6Z1K6_AMBMO|nr:unnamed protein product [Ambrosiozyma monospora]